jgi:hypothetical protein
MRLEGREMYGLKQSLSVVTGFSPLKISSFGIKESIACILKVAEFLQLLPSELKSSVWHDGIFKPFGGCYNT